MANTDFINSILLLDDKYGQQLLFMWNHRQSIISAR